MRDSSPTNKDTPVVEDEGHPPRLNEVSKKFIADCIAEKARLSEDFPVAAMLLDEAIDRVHATGRIPGREMHADVFKQKLTKVTQKVFVPIKQFPNFNFNGKILGPRGNSLRNLQKQTLCRILIKGRNSMRDAQKEEELRESGDPRHAHLNKDLYVEISTVATPAEAHARVAYALAEIRKYLIPDSNDEVSQNQRKEMLADPEFSKKTGSSFADEKGQANNTPGVSILQKITGFTGHSNDNEMDFEEDKDDQPRSHNSYIPPRNTQRPPIKRSLQEPSPYYQGRTEPERDGGRPLYRGQGNARPGVSILRKITGFTGQVYDEDDHQGEIEYNILYEDEEPGYIHNTRQPIRQMSQRPTAKRFFQEPPSYVHRRYENPQKRTREAQSGEQKTSRYDVSQNY